MVAPRGPVVLLALATSRLSKSSRFINYHHDSRKWSNIFARDFSRFARRARRNSPRRLE
jgi:hypothetical protein